jgi:rubrerythrin
VEQLKRSLKVVPWEYAEPVIHGKVKLQACKDCPHNSETDRTLFGLESDSQNPRGYCLNASCFETKQKAADAAKAAVYQKVAKRQDQSPATIRRVAPRWLKDSAVVGFVQRQLKKAADGDKKPKPKTGTRKAETGRELTPHEKALVAFAKAEESWQIESFKAILEAINANPAYRVGWCLLAGTAVFQNQANWQFPTVSIHSKEPATESPTLPKLKRKIKQAIELAMKGTKAAWVELASWTPQDHPDDWDDIGWMHPEALVTLAEAVGAKLSKRPEWKAPVDIKPVPVKT